MKYFEGWGVIAGSVILLVAVISSVFYLLFNRAVRALREMNRHLDHISARLSSIDRRMK